MIRNIWQMNIIQLSSPWWGRRQGGGRTVRNCWKRQEWKSEFCAKPVDGAVREGHPGKAAEIKTKFKKSQ